MNRPGPKKIVLLGIMSRMPVGGLVWATVHYLVGFQRLGYDVYYVEEHGCTPRMFMQERGDDVWEKAAAFIASVMARFDLGGRWAFRALHDGRLFGLSEGQLRTLYDAAALVVNLHGATRTLPAHRVTDRLVYLETDPVDAEIELYDNVQETIDFLAAHSAFFTWGLNYGHPDCRVPLPERFRFRPTLPPVVLDFWKPYGHGGGDTFTTIGNWRQLWREVKFQGEVYSWSKHLEFLKVLDLPRRTTQPCELALASYEEADRRLLESRGWTVRDALDFSADLDAYRQYIARSRGEFTVAKDQNVRLRSGWFSERSATYLAAGRPVITQDTGFGNVLPTGRGLFAFSSLDDALEAMERINAAYEDHRRAAATLAHEHFSHDVVLPRLLAEVGL